MVSIVKLKRKQPGRAQSTERSAKRLYSQVVSAGDQTNAGDAVKDELGFKPSNAYGLKVHTQA